MKQTNRNLQTMEQNHFSGSYVGYNKSIKTFHCDTHLSACYSFSFEGGVLFSIHSVKRNLWSLQSPLGYLIGIGNPFSNINYTDYLCDFSYEVLDRLKEEFEKYEFSTSNPIMFGINGACRVVKCKDGLYYLYFPDGTYEVSQINDPPTFTNYQMCNHKSYIGDKIIRWVRSQLKYIAGIEKRWMNSREADEKLFSDAKK